MIVQNGSRKPDRRDLRGRQADFLAAFAQRGGDGVARRSGSMRPPGKLTCPAWWRKPSVRRVSSTCLPSLRVTRPTSTAASRNGAVGQQVVEIVVVPAGAGGRRVERDAAPRAGASGPGPRSFRRVGRLARGSTLPSGAGARRRSSAASARSRRPCGGSPRTGRRRRAADADAGAEDGAEGGRHGYTSRF